MTPLPFCSPIEEGPTAVAWVVCHMHSTLLSCVWASDRVDCIFLVTTQRTALTVLLIAFGIRQRSIGFSKCPSAPVSHLRVISIRVVAVACLAIALTCYILQSKIDVPFTGGSTTLHTVCATIGGEAWTVPQITHWPKPAPVTPHRIHETLIAT